MSNTDSTMETSSGGVGPDVSLNAVGEGSLAGSGKDSYSEYTYDEIEVEVSVNSEDMELGPEDAKAGMEQARQRVRLAAKALAAAVLVFYVSNFVFSLLVWADTGGLADPSPPYFSMNSYYEGDLAGFDYETNLTANGFGIEHYEKYDFWPRNFTMFVHINAILPITLVALRLIRANYKAVEPVDILVRKEEDNRRHRTKLGAVWSTIVAVILFVAVLVTGIVLLTSPSPSSVEVIFNISFTVLGMGLVGVLVYLIYANVSYMYARDEHMRHMASEVLVQRPEGAAAFGSHVRLLSQREATIRLQTIAIGVLQSVILVHNLVFSLALVNQSVTDTSFDLGFVLFVGGTIPASAIIYVVCSLTYIVSKTKGDRYWANPRGFTSHRRSVYGVSMAISFLVGFACAVGGWVIANVELFHLRGFDYIHDTERRQTPATTWFYLTFAVLLFFQGLLLLAHGITTARGSDQTRVVQDDARNFVRKTTIKRVKRRRRDVSAAVTDPGTLA